MALSTLARLMRQNAFQDFNTGEAGPRSSPASPALPGFARGSLGTSGSVPFQSRNVNAGEQQERNTLSGPIGQAFEASQPQQFGFGDRLSAVPPQAQQLAEGFPGQGGGGGGGIMNAFQQLLGGQAGQQGNSRRQQILQMLLQRFGQGGGSVGGAGGGGGTFGSGRF